MISVDYDQIELRIAAALSGEISLIDAAKRGESLHKTAAIKLFGPDYTPDQYRYTKNLNFGWLFGGGADTLSKQVHISINQAAKVIADYEMAFPYLKRYKVMKQNALLNSALTPCDSRVYKALRQRMYTVRADTSEGLVARRIIKRQIHRLLGGKVGYTTTLFGRRLIIDAEKAFTVVNHEIQSTARDVMATALLRVMDDSILAPTLLLPIHDEFLAQVPSDEADYYIERYCSIMRTTINDVPLTASGKVYGPSWGHGYVK
jgi:DNA polymerase-1